MSNFFAAQIVHRRSADDVRHWDIPLPSDLPKTRWRMLLWGSKKTLVDQADKIVSTVGVPKGYEAMVSIARYDSGIHFGNRCTLDNLPRTRVLYVDRLVNDVVDLVSSSVELDGGAEDKRQTESSMKRIALIRKWDKLTKAIDRREHIQISHIRAIAVAMNSTFTEDSLWLRNFGGLRLALVQPEWSFEAADAYFQIAS